MGSSNRPREVNNAHRALDTNGNTIEQRNVKYATQNILTSSNGSANGDERDCHQQNDDCVVELFISKPNLQNAIVSNEIQSQLEKI